MRGLVWFREDLRIHDHTALFNATKKCDEIVGVYFVDIGMWKNHRVATCRIEFILRGLKQLSADLAKFNIPLVIIKVENTTDIPHELLKLSQSIQVNSLFFNRQYEVDEAKRDQDVVAQLKTHQISSHIFDDQIILPPGSVTTRQGYFFKIFTPYKQAWQKVFVNSNIKILPSPKPQNLTSNIKSSAIPFLPEFRSTIDPTLWPSGELPAQRILQFFIRKKLSAYDKQRDFPYLDGTSRLSPYLSAGMISPRQCFIAALTTNDNQLTTGNNGIVAWMTELIWRDFYKHILIEVPRICTGKAYKIETEKLLWQFNQKQFDAWKNGQTGYPIIDAGMRQLNSTGWMHNRLRMIVAMFFTKNLFFDWRLGEEYFMNHLIDGDFAANNGGWQWCASTGVDAVPYFRIFNPTKQSRRYDPDGNFIRQFCPELSRFDNKAIHEPYAYSRVLAKQCRYPLPITNLQQSRKLVMSAFKAIMPTRPSAFLHGSEV